MDIDVNCPYIEQKKHINFEYHLIGSIFGGNNQVLTQRECGAWVDNYLYLQYLCNVIYEKIKLFLDILYFATFILTTIF